MKMRLNRSAFAARPFWLLIAAACLVPALLSALTSYLNARFAGRGVFDWTTIFFASALWLIFGALTPLTYVFARRYPLRHGQPVRTVMVHAGGAILLCLGWISLSCLLALVLNRRPTQETFARYYFSWLLTSLPWSVVLYFTVLGCVYAFTYYREARERESQQARLTTQLAEARLSALRMQLNPHFLFNSLNAITVLVRDNNTVAATRMLELLSGVLRQVLQGEQRQEITLDEELRFIKQYLAIEQVRFSDRLQVQWSIDPGTRNALVPEFILQPIVENAIRHGIARRTEAGIVELSAARDAGVLRLTVRDNGPGYHPGGDSGVGIANTRARLRTLFGEAAEFEVTAAEVGGTVASMRLPLRCGGG